MRGNTVTYAHLTKQAKTEISNINYTFSLKTIDSSHFRAVWLKTQNTNETLTMRKKT